MHALKESGHVQDVFRFRFHRPSCLWRCEIYVLDVQCFDQNLHHSDQLLHDGDVEEGEVVGAGALHVRDDHHPLDVQLVCALLQNISQFLITRIIYDVG